MKVSELQINQRIYPLDAVKVQKPKPVQVDGDNKKVKSFAEVLKQNLEPGQDVKFSAHALKRIEERQLNMGEQTLDRLIDGISRLNEKGSKNSVIFLDETAFIVSVQNRTIVTALDKANNSQNIFTNIDSAAIV